VKHRERLSVFSSNKKVYLMVVELIGGSSFSNNLVTGAVPTCISF
jgi:hypothetical protein